MSGATVPHADAPSLDPDQLPHPRLTFPSVRRAAGTGLSAREMRDVVYRAEG
jgi:hypothetical protein